jgi:hypothetical protein
MYLSPGLPEIAQAARSLESAARDHLKSLRDWNFHWLLGCTFAVGFGLLLELPEIAHDMCEIYGRKSRELKYWLVPSIDRREYPKRDWVKKWSAFGWVLIVLGVMGEGWFEAQVSKYDSALSNMTDAVVAEAQKESANAEATAKGFDAQIAESDAKAKSAEATAKQFEAQIAGAQKDAAESKKEAESERLARVQLQKELQPRRLTGEQKKKLTALLIDQPVPIGMLYIPFCGECSDFANDIGDALNKAGWKTVFIPASTWEHGVEIGTAKESDMTLLMPVMQKLKNALLVAGAPSRISSFDRKNRGTATELEKNVLYLAVDNKPDITPAP